jgi:hypothetical protein
MLVSLISVAFLTTQAAPPPTNVQPAPEARTCRRERLTGSNRTLRVCTTRSERENLEAQARQFHNRLVNDTPTPESETNPGHGGPAVRRAGG